MNWGRNNLRRKPSMDSLWYVEHVKEMEKLVKEVLNGPKKKKHNELHWTTCGYCKKWVPWESMRSHYFKRHAAN